MSVLHNIHTDAEVDGGVCVGGKGCQAENLDRSTPRHRLAYQGVPLHVLRHNVALVRIKLGVHLSVDGFLTQGHRFLQKQRHFSNDGWYQYKMCSSDSIISDHKRTEHEREGQSG